MNLKQLGAEYLNSEQRLRRRIDQLRRLQSGAEGEARKKLTSRINYLYSIAAESHAIGQYLIEYYDRGNSVAN